MVTVDVSGELGDYRRISDYAVIGDCRSAALISSEGSIDWLCFPRFDSPSVFGSLLDTTRGGFLAIRPAGRYDTERRYVPDTNVLETVFHCDGGSFILRDLMPVASEVDKRTDLLPDHEVLRQIEVTDGGVDLEIDYRPRPDYGRGICKLQPRGLLGIWLNTPQGAFILASDVLLELNHDCSAARGRVTLKAGQTRYVSFSFTEDAPAIVPPLASVAANKVARTIGWWRDWVGRCTYQGPYRDAVVRSALALKLMAYAPSGAVVAAPTTSLPEQMGGIRNWDYRYCWLRDASFTVRALFSLNYHEEAHAFLSWMLQATRLTAPELQVVYDVFGEARLPERQLDHLEGYKGSKPVRVGNDAHGQLQLDVYGEVLDAVARFADLEGAIDRDTAKFLDGLGHTVCKRWREPDEGIWEGRAGRYHHTHSKVLCWVALDRLIHMHELGSIKVSADAFRRERDAIRGAIEDHGFNPRLGSYTRLFDGDDVDASLLTLPLYGYVDGNHPRMLSTFSVIYEKLAKRGLVYRYEASTSDGLPPGEGAFGICGFWAVECQARGGQVDAATSAFEQLLTNANDVGLYPEEIDPLDGSALGNFPQAFTHLGLINAALTLLEVSGQQVMAKPAMPPDLNPRAGP